MGEAGGAEESRRRAGTEEEFVKVRKKDLERLTTEVMQIRDFLPRILNGEVLESFQKLKIVGKNLESKEQELEQLRLDCEHFKARLESVQVDNVREKKEKLALRQQLNEAKQQLLQQAEYCTEMGAAACTILWGVSSSEEVVKAILGGDKALKFFNITGQTMESFVKSLDGDVKELDSDENQFVFALAGIVTNVAAIASGREFLVNSSRVLLDTILQLLGDLKPGQCTKLKVVINGLMDGGAYRSEARSWNDSPPAKASALLSSPWPALLVKCAVVRTPDTRGDRRWALIPFPEEKSCLS
ncbi:heat shock factor 2-binding protein isoform X6 [Hippopotamus amphibius kiboko]|uniref:heat shock factor 2-binding protein isoform X6 n=1 Tax=Hippopotamus amphibius kiboko TaxID=575201 RepID=UPI0025998A69|nr:heat shock factor 2-binding protein isoform X6 [Hippopotamus amphibius kiboko]